MAAAIAGTFCDIRTVKTRGMLQIVIEIPLDQADAALKTLGGIPQPSHERWVAVAPLKAEPAPKAKEVEEPKPASTTPGRQKRSWDTLSRAQQAGLMGQDEAFRSYMEAESVEDCAAMVRLHCAVVSRAELDLGTAAAERWDGLVATFRDWQAQERAQDQAAAYLRSP